MVVAGCIAYAIFGVLSVRKDNRVVFVLVIGTALFVLAQDWLTQQTLPVLLQMNCTNWTIR
jgi:hypothetical protein